MNTSNDTAWRAAVQAANYGLGVEITSPNGYGEYDVFRAVAPLGSMPAPMPICQGTKRHDQPVWFRFLQWIMGY